jgi:thioesterase domain-containing protein
MIKPLQTFLYQEIPLTKDMGLKIKEYSPELILTTAPLNQNINDKGSVFGGSSSALMIITAWSLIKLNCQKHGITSDIVIHKNETTWNKALYEDLIIQARFKKSYNFNDIKHALKRSKPQRVECFIELQDEAANIYSTMTTKYVIIP